MFVVIVQDLKNNAYVFRFSSVYNVRMFFSLGTDNVIENALTAQLCSDLWSDHADKLHFGSPQNDQASQELLFDGFSRLIRLDLLE